MSAVCYCEFCGHEMRVSDIEQILAHVKDVHPEHYVEPLRWPDGEVAVMWENPDMETIVKAWGGDAGR